MIAIKDKQMPRYCAECFVEDCPHKSGAANRLIYQRECNRPADCPLVEIGTCKDCRHYVGALIDNTSNIYKTSYCRKHGKNVHREDFYCADFEKRGSENESIN